MMKRACEYIYIESVSLSAFFSEINPKAWKAVNFVLRQGKIMQQSK